MDIYVDIKHFYSSHFLLATCDLDDVISDNSRFAALLWMSGVLAIMNLVGAGLLIASLTSSSIGYDKSTVIIHNNR